MSKPIQIPAPISHHLNKPLNMLLPMRHISLVPYTVSQWCVYKIGIDQYKITTMFCSTLRKNIYPIFISYYTNNVIYGVKDGTYVRCLPIDHQDKIKEQLKTFAERNVIKC